MNRRADRVSVESQKPFFLGRSESLLAVDDLVSRLIHTLRAKGELKNTYFIFTSDNGFLLGEHGLTGKALPYEESVRVPLLIRGPGIEPGSRDDTLVANIDLAPTITQLAGAKPGRLEDGRSLVPLLRDRDLPTRDLEFEYLTDRSEFRAVRTERWTYVRYRTGGSELYDLKHDPYELHNLVRSRRYAGVRSRLTRKLDRLADCSGTACR